MDLIKYVFCYIQSFWDEQTNIFHLNVNPMYLLYVRYTIHLAISHLKMSLYNMSDMENVYGKWKLYKFKYTKDNVY